MDDSTILLLGAGALLLLPSLKNVGNTVSNISTGIQQVSSGISSVSDTVFNPLPSTPNDFFSGMSLFNLAVPISQFPIMFENIKEWL